MTGSNDGDPPDTYEQVSVGTEANCAVRSGDGQGYCWGNDVELGHIDDTPYSEVAESMVAVVADEGLGVYCGITNTADVACVINDVSKYIVEPVTPGPFTAIAAGSGNWAALREDGTMYCAGYLECESAFGEQQFIVLDVDSSTVCGVTTGHELMCHVSEPEYLPWPPANPPAGSDFVSVTLGGNVGGCALDSAGRATCWGEAGFGLVDDVPSDTFLSLAGSSSDTICGVTTEHHVVCWGNDDLINGIDFEM